MTQRLIVSLFLTASLSSVSLAQTAPLPLPLPPAATAPSAAAGETRAAPLPSLPTPLPPSSAAAPPIASKPVAIDAMPQVATPAAPSSVLAGLYMPGISAALLANKGRDLPDFRDVRRFVFSIYEGLASVCGPFGDSAALTAMGYVEPGLGPGRDAAQVGLQKGMQFLLGMAQAQRTGDVNALLRSQVEESPRITEGQTDGATLASRLGCRTPDYNGLVSSVEQLMRTKSGIDPSPGDQVVLATLMSVSYRAQLGIEDPTVTLRKRKIDRASSDGQKQCTSRYDSPGFCPCLFGRLKSHELDESEWEAIGSQFTAVVSIASRKPDVAQSIRTCVRGS